MTVIVKHNKTNSITDWTQAQLDEQIALGNFAPGTTLANIVLPSDWNNDHTLTGLGTMAEQDATAVAITGGTINNTTIGATTATTGKFTSVTTPSVTASSGNLTLTPVASNQIYLNQSAGGAFGAVLGQDVSTPQNSARLFFDSNVNVASIRNNAGGGLAISTGATIGSTSGAIQFLVSPTTSAVNYVQVTGSATGTGNSPTISSQGSDTDVNLTLAPKAAGLFRVTSGVGGSSRFSIDNGGVTNLGISGSGGSGFRVSPTTSQVNFYSVSGSIAGLVPVLTTGLSSDTNVSMAFQPKGTGAIDLAAGSSGVNISNGGTVTAITRTAGGSGYATAPTVAISAPTTAGGVQATATCTVTAGAVNTTFTITNAGSGYIEQPTITFSGGGGSGAAAYATVGSGTIVRGIGSTMDFANPNGVGLRVNSTAISSNLTDYVELSGGASGVTNGVYVRAGGSTTNNSVYIQSKGTGSISFFTNWTTSAAEQLRASHTASAVNYVQVTGAATGVRPSITVAGSDGTIGLNIAAKGGEILFLNNGVGTNAQFSTTFTAASVNYLTATGSGATGNAPRLYAQGTDTNINIKLDPKGTGKVQFGTYTGTILTPTGYVEIVDSGGTTRRLLVG
jgi:hypothetical protein